MKRANVRLMILAASCIMGTVRLERAQAEATGKPASEGALYRVQLPADPNARQVAELRIDVEASSEGADAVWYRLIGTKVNEESYKIWFLAEGDPLHSRSPGGVVVRRYILQEGDQTPIEYVDGRTGRALTPLFGFVENLLPHPDKDSNDVLFYEGTYLGHPIVRVRTLSGEEMRIPPVPRRLVFRTDLIVGTSRNFRDDGKGRESREADYRYVPFTGDDYAEMIAAGINYFRVKTEQMAWVCREPVFYDTYGPDVAFPEELYRSNFLGTEMFLDEPACLLAGKYPPDSPLSTAVAMIHEHIEKKKDSLRYDEMVRRGGIDMGSLKLIEPSIPIWETYVETSYYQLEAHPVGIVQECRWRIDPNGDSQQILMLQRINEEFGVEIPVTGENLFLWFYSQMRGPARAFDAKWGMSIYGQAEPDLRFASMKLAYDLGAEFIWFWTSDHDHHVPYREQLRLAREITEYASKQPIRDLVRLRRAAQTAIVLPYGYTLPTSWQLHTWGTHIYPLGRKNSAGLTYKEVLRPAVQEIARCLKDGVVYDVAPAGRDFDPRGYQRIFWVQEDGSCRLTVSSDR